MYTYEIYRKEDQHNPRYNMARRNLKGEGQDAYILLSNGVATTIQFEYNTPYPALTIEESAELHIEELNSGEG